MAAREEGMCDVRLERLMGDAKHDAEPPGGENVDEKIAALKAAAAAREREFKKLGIGNVARGETRGTDEESKKSFSRADADASIARLEKAVAEFKALGPLTPGPMTPQTKAEIEAEVTARLPKFPPGTPPLPEFDYDPREVDELLTQLEAEEAERAAAKKKGEGEQQQQQHHHAATTTTTTTTAAAAAGVGGRGQAGRQPPLPPGVSRTGPLVLEALAEADLEVRDPEVEGSNPAWVDVRDPATPNALKPAEDDSIGKEHTRATDGATTDRTPRGLERTDASPGDEAIDAKIAELRETMRGCAELIARHARDDPTKTKLVRDLAHVLNAASEKESRVETERAKGGDETVEGDEPATSESLLESLPGGPDKYPTPYERPASSYGTWRNASRPRGAAPRQSHETAAAVRDFRRRNRRGRARRPAGAHRGGDAEGTGQAQRGTVGPPPVCVRFGKRVRRRLGRGGLARPDAALGWQRA